MSKKLRIFTDGGARGNPGPAGIGVVIQAYDAQLKDYHTKKTIKKYIGEATNNQAEYQALIAALEAVKELGAEEIECMLDSELMVKQLRHEYKVKNRELAELFVKIFNLASGFKKISYQHIRREFNKEADRLVNQAIDEALGKGV